MALCIGYQPTRPARLTDIKGKIMIRKFLSLVAILFASNHLNLYGIENLRISVVGSNVVLFWPSLTNETYIVEHRSSFSTNTPWVSLASNYPAQVGTNWTAFIHSNIVEFAPPCSTGGGSGPCPWPSCRGCSPGSGSC